MYAAAMMHVGTRTGHRCALYRFTANPMSGPCWGSDSDSGNHACSLGSFGDSRQPARVQTRVFSLAGHGYWSYLGDTILNASTPMIRMQLVLIYSGTDRG